MQELDLVFEGGGAKGVAFAGALEVLLENDRRVQRVVGTSAGAVSAVLLAAGYGPDELVAAVTERTADGRPRFTAFMDEPKRRDFTPADLDASVSADYLQVVDLPWIPESVERRLDRFALRTLLRFGWYRRLFSLVERGGLYRGDAFLEWLQEKLAAKGFAPDVTLAELARETGVDVSTVASDTAHREMLVLNGRTTPELPAAWAVRMSMSIPFVWQEVVWRPEWGFYRGRSKQGATIVDGGVLSNFPIRLIVEPNADDRRIMGATECDPARAFGLLIDEDLPVETTEGLLDWVAQTRTVGRLTALADTMMAARDNEAIRRFASRICRLPAKGYGTLEFDLEGERLERFLDAGRRAMHQHLEARGMA